MEILQISTDKLFLTFMNSINNMKLITKKYYVILRLLI